MVCKNHPETNARRHCYHCKKPICPACQEKAYHHIFCGAECIEVFAKKKDSQSAELQDILSEFDKSLNEDLREYGDAIVGELAQRIEILEQKSLSSIEGLKSKFEQKTSAFHEEGLRKTQDLTTQFTALDRKLREAAEEEIDKLNQIKNSLNTTRSDSDESFKELYEQLQRQIRAAKVFFRRRDHRVSKQQEALESLVAKSSGEQKSHAKSLTQELQSHLSKLREEQIQLEEKSQEELLAAYKNLLQTASAKHEELAKRLQGLGSDLNTLQSTQKMFLEQTLSAVDAKAKELTEAFEKTRQEQAQKIEAVLSSLEKKHASLEKHVQTQLAHHLETLNKNWSDVMAAASMGAKSAGYELRHELQQKLKQDLNDLSTEHHAAFKDLVATLKDGIRKRLGQVLSPWTGKIGLAISSATLVVLIGLGGLVMSHRNKPAEMASSSPEILEKITDLTAKLDSLMEQIEQTRASSAVAKVETQDVQEQAKLEKGLDITHANRGNVLKKEFSFTFDGGSNARAAYAILDILKSKNIKTTMFLTGTFIDANPEIVMRIAQDGHEAANHLLQHEHMLDPQSNKMLYTKERLLNELKLVEDAYTRVTHQKMSKIWRAPFGEINKAMIAWAAQEGYTHVGWSRSGRISLDTLDWVTDRTSKIYRTPQGIMDHILKFEKTDPNGLNGAIVLMHLGSDRAPDQMAHLRLPEFLDYVSHKGYKVVPVSQTLRSDLAKN